MSTARRLPRSRIWLRSLVLLLALLVPGAHAHAHAVPATAGVSGEAAAEQDVLDTILRPPARTDRRTPVRLHRPAPPPQPAPGVVPARPSHTAPPRPPYVPEILRTVVLRC